MIVIRREFQVVKRELNDIINIFIKEDMDDMLFGFQMCNIVLYEFQELCYFQYLVFMFIYMYMLYKLVMLF